MSDAQLSWLVAGCIVVATGALVFLAGYAVHDSQRARRDLEATLENLHQLRVNLAASSVPRSVFDPAEEL